MSNQQTTKPDIRPEDAKLINETPFLNSLCYDLNILPEQFGALKDDPSYDKMRALLAGVLICYRAMKEVENVQA